MSDQHRDVSGQSDEKRLTRDVRDRFDDIPKERRVGAHRISTKIRRFWQYLIAALIGTAVLGGAGVLYVNSLGDGMTQIFDRDRPGAGTPTVTPKLDPEITVAVLNGTTTPGLQDIVAAAITEGEWATVGFADVAAADDVTISAVFYSAAADEPAALALAQQLGGVSTYQSSDYEVYGVRLGVLLGADYAGPGAESMDAADPQSSSEAGSDEGGDDAADGAADGAE